MICNLHITSNFFCLASSSQAILLNQQSFGQNSFLSKSSSTVHCYGSFRYTTNYEEVSHAFLKNWSTLISDQIKTYFEGKSLTTPDEKSRDGAVVVLSEDTDGTESLLPHFIQTLEHT